MSSLPKAALGQLLLDASAGFACGQDADSGVFQFRMNNVTVDGRLDLTRRRRVPRDARNLQRFMLQSGDVLFNATNSPDLVGKSAFFPGLDEPATFSNHFLRLRPREAVLDGRFLSRWLNLQFQRGRFKMMCRQWVNQAAVSRDALLSVEFPLPSIAEQRRIAAILDKADELRAKRRAALAQLDTLTQSIFLDMFGDPATNPKRWPVDLLQHVVRHGTIVTYGIVQAGDEWPGGVPYIRTGDIVDGEIDSLRLRRTDPAIAARFARSRVEAGDIVMSIRATVGTTAIVPEHLAGANLTQGTARIAPGDHTERAYLLAALRSEATQRWIGRQIKGATFREITLTRLRELPVVVPPMPLQQEYARLCGAVYQLRSTERSALAANEALFSSLQHRAFQAELGRDARPE